ncbi:hypothetical protein M408DRAFT_328098 [Serendipita vermifera MAFF 305830]|uniref:Mid2 domain-containing protein n=1 Tax=Serendipita vermifera MAFF 305830 TaxID=933852 RepID=A0A0C2WWN7_SERVB|nr:hypothetical protein M408DRAFT_328098 [Serendipita vermifera MAFF 305830]
MVTIRAIVALCLFTTYSTVLATPIEQVSHLRAARANAEDTLYQLYPRQEQQALSQPVTFQTVTTTQTQAGTITTTCNVTLSPITAADGSTQIRQEKQCKFDVSPAGGSDNQSSSSSTSNGGQTQTSTSSAATETATESQATQTQTTQTLSSSVSSATATATGTAPPAVSVIGPGVIDASSTGTVSGSSSVQSSVSATATGSAPPAVSVIGPGQIPVSATGTASQASASVSGSASLVTSVTTLSNGQVSTAITTPTAAAAEQQAATTPGQKLEVLPIGLGVFAGVSVIALIVVGLVTYERTKYRKAFRQRKLAEAGANMGYGGMAERT